jgi:iron complex outermembrane recepter protein
MKNILLLAIFAMLGISVQINAQTKTVTGKVTDSKDGSSLPGVTIKVKNANVGTVSGSDGGYSLKVSNNATKLSVSSVGYESKDIDIPASGELNISMMASTSQLEEVVVSTGSRNSKRTMTDTPLPIDVISAADLRTTGQTTFDKALQYSVPSFNTVNTPVNDATSLLDPYEIRGMGPSRTLVLINGKRKNTSALLYIQTSPGRGESGADISAIPQQAIKRVEILRDGASAQYGSDAIAGVMNIILKDKFDYGSAQLTAGITGKGDGQHIGFAVNNGSNFANGGFVNYTLDFSRTALANRPGKVSAEAEADGNLGFGAPLADVRKFLALKPDAGNINGQPENTAAKFLINAGFPVGDNTELYFNAAYVYKRVNSFANYRTPYWRTTDDGLLTPAGQPYIGYVPGFQGDLNDYNATVGVRKENNGWKTDLSFTTGGNKQLYTVSNSRNRSLGRNSPTYFKPGGYEFSHNVGNIDISKAVNEKFNVAFGSEFRAESFTVFAGDTASFVGTGADSFPGTSPTNAGTNTRFNFGGYVDLSYDISDRFLVNGTIRAEQYSDFGSTVVYKLSSRYKINDQITLRGSYSTGFRAPLLHQIYQQLAQASFVPGQGIQTKGIVNNVSPQAFALGVPKLTPEKSTNFTMGVGLNPSKDLSVTLDYYNIQVKDRIILGSEIAGTSAGNTALDKILTSNGIVAVSFFANALNTTTSGLDFVVSQRNLTLGQGKLGISLAGNYTFENKYTSVNNPKLIADAGKSVFDPIQNGLLFTSRPQYKAILGLNYLVKGITFNLANTLFGPTRFHQNGLDDDTDTEFTPAIVTDLAISVPLSKATTFTLNVNNILNVLPKWDFVNLKTGVKTRYNPDNNVPSDKYFNQYNLITFNGRYSNVTYDGSQFSQLGTIFNAALNVKF